ncbi:hypothetical protein MHYP_G00147620 [Metynnis hypsauchen]
MVLTDGSKSIFSDQTDTVSTTRHSRDLKQESRLCWTDTDTEMMLHVPLLLSLLSVPGLSASTENLAAGAKAVQSSTVDGSGDAQNAVDGKRNTDYRRGSCSHTNYERDPWWRVELPAVYNVTSVTITNRGDCCGDRINGAQIRIGNSLKNNGNENKLVAVIHSLQTGATSTFSFSAAEGQFVNILLPGGGKILTLCEVEVWTENIAAGAKAVQSSTQERLGNAQNAVDGNNNTDYRRGSCTLSKFEADPWWRVELPGVCNVTSVTITNRGDCCGHRINGAQIRIGNSLKNNGNNNKLVAVIGPLGSEVTKTYRFRATDGRYVNIFLPGENKILTLCEVEVFADEEFRPDSLYLHGECSSV